MAQCFAAGAGAFARTTGKPPAAWGYLAALRDIAIHGDARLGDTLTISVHVVTALGPVTVLEGEVRSAGALLAAGQLKAFIPEQEEG
jgi:predicted hotdog family 3-hydroxylacyl-ACP dehydratase